MKLKASVYFGHPVEAATLWLGRRPGEGGTCPCAPRGSNGCMYTYVCFFKLTSDDNFVSNINMTISNAAQFGLLLWKNWLLQKRSIVQTLLLIIWPTVMSLLALFNRINTDSIYDSLPTIGASFSASQLPPSLMMPTTFRGENGSLLDPSLVYSPNTSNATTRIAAETAKTLNLSLIGHIIMLIYICIR